MRLCLQDVPESLQCIKIFTAGHEVPSDATILSFKRAVHRFLKDNEDNGDAFTDHQQTTQIEMRE